MSSNMVQPCPPPATVRVNWDGKPLLFQLRFTIPNCQPFSTAETMTAQDIAADEHVDVRTVYNDMNEAISALTPRIFGIDGLKPADISKSLH